LHHVVLERWSRGDSVLHRRDPRIKVLLLLVFLVSLGTLPRISVISTGAFTALVLGAAVLARLPVGGILLRAAAVLPFSATFALVNWLAGDPGRAAGMLAKSYLSTAAVLVLAGTTPLPKLLRGLEGLGAPRFLVLVVQFLYRYLFVISEQAQHMRLAAQSRGGGGTAAFRAAAGAVAVLFARSHLRAGAIHSAMLARGFSGRIEVLAAGGLRAADGVLLVTGVALILALRLGLERLV
jgi:cobalt/nickel transport system permease protein